MQGAATEGRPDNFYAALTPDGTVCFLETGVITWAERLAPHFSPVDRDVGQEN